MVTRYLKALMDIVHANDRPRGTYRYLLEKLYDTTFRWSVEMDKNREIDGLALRDQVMGYANAMDEPCNVLEMLIALAQRCENDIMQDDTCGDRTYKWFWLMIDNLGLSSMTDKNYDENIVTHILSDFLDRKYDANGNGSIFYVHGSHKDLREVELWYQMCWFLNERMSHAI